MGIFGKIQEYRKLILYQSLVLLTSQNYKIVKKILILSANPKNSSRLRLDEEVREIQGAIKRAKNREQFEIVTEWAVRVDDLRRALLEHQPGIVHCSGHGLGCDGLVLENLAGEAKLVSTESLAKLFNLFQAKIECVLLNACYSEAQAEAIYQHINCVIGMNQAVGDKAAIAFAVGFYDALGAGYSYKYCYDIGCASVDLEGIPESATPVLKFRPQPSQEEHKTENHTNQESITQPNNSISQTFGNDSIGFGSIGSAGNINIQR